MAEKNKKTITGQVLNSIKINKIKCIYDKEKYNKWIKRDYF